MDQILIAIAVTAVIFSPAVFLLTKWIISDYVWRNRGYFAREDERERYKLLSRSRKVIYFLNIKNKSWS